MIRIDRSALLAIGAAASLALTGVPQAAAPVQASQDVIAQTKAAQAAMTPAEALRRLEAGNDRFTSGRMLERDLRKQVAVTAAGQYPFATVLSCIDSRSAPELVFDQGIGDIFSLRIAGNVVTDDMLGSLEFATRLAGSKLIVVLGHSACGAVKGACDRVTLGHLTDALEPITAAVIEAAGSAAPPTSKDAAFVQKVADINVARAVRQIRDRSPILRDLIEKGELNVVGAMLDIGTGKVTFLEGI